MSFVEISWELMLEQDLLGISWEHLAEILPQSNVEILQPSPRLMGFPVFFDWIN
jgi:hypothetical protein